MKKSAKKCCICGKPVFTWRSIYCRTCSHFSARMSDERFPPKTRQALWSYIKRRGYTCSYTGIEELNVFDKSDPYFLEFDHVKPADPSKIAITCSLVNEMKGDMTVSEFKRTIRQLFNCFFKHIRMKKSKFRYWYRLRPSV
jgi:hypothetical protein